MDKWLKGAALGEQRGGRCQVTLLIVDGVLVGFYAVALAIIKADGLLKKHTGSDRRTNPQAGFLLAKLAVSADHHRQGFGSLLAVAGVLRCLRASTHVGGRVIVVDFARPELSGFYKQIGFVHSAKGDHKGDRRVMAVADAISDYQKAGYEF